MMYVLVERDSGKFELALESDGTVITNWSDDPRGPTDKAVKMAMVRDCIDLTDPQAMAEAITIAANGEYRYLRESDPAYPPWE